MAATALFPAVQRTKRGTESLVKFLIGTAPQTLLVLFVPGKRNQRKTQSAASAPNSIKRAIYLTDTALSGFCLLIYSRIMFSVREFPADTVKP
jgi:hypothetical protein